MKIIRTENQVTTDNMLRMARRFNSTYSVKVAKEKVLFISCEKFISDDEEFEVFNAPAGFDLYEFNKFMANVDGYVYAVFIDGARFMDDAGTMSEDEYIERLCNIANNGYGAKCRVRW